MTQKKKFYLITFLVVLSTCIQYDLGSGNPIPNDENWEVSPYPYEYNGSIAFVKECINVTFDATKANIIASYTFENLNNAACNITIYLPYLNYRNEDNKPIITQLLLDGNNINYDWSELTENFSRIYTPSSLWDWYDEYYLIEIKILFEANETKVLEIHYTRTYMKYDYYDNNKIYYEYKYFVGSARLWNHSIERADFNFWIPKSICDEIAKPRNSAYIGNNISSLVEYKDHYFVNVKYENWTLPVIKEDYYFDVLDYVIIQWKNTKPFYMQSSFKMFLWFGIIPAIAIPSLLLITFRISKKRKVGKT